MNIIHCICVDFWISRIGIGTSISILDCIALHCITLHYLTLHDITVTLHCIKLHQKICHCTPYHLQVVHFRVTNQCQPCGGWLPVTALCTRRWKRPMATLGMTARLIRSCGVKKSWSSQHPVSQLNIFLYIYYILYNINNSIAIIRCLIFPSVPLEAFLGGWDDRYERPTARGLPHVQGLKLWVTRYQGWFYMLV